MVKWLLRNLPKIWRSTVVAIRKAKDLNKISLDEICGSFLTYEQKVNQIDEEKKKLFRDARNTFTLTAIGKDLSL